MSRLPWFLIVLLLYAHTAQAWHAPIHIDDFEVPVTQLADDQACPFGANGHGTAATGTGCLPAFCATSVSGILFAPPSLYQSDRGMRPPSRGPPSFHH